MKYLKVITVFILVVLLSVALVACGNDALQQIVEEINNDTGMHNELRGYFTVRAEARGPSTVVVVLRAERNELEDPEVAELMAVSGESFFREAVREMRAARISNPILLLEFLDMRGIIIYTHEFS